MGDGYLNPNIKKKMGIWFKKEATNILDVCPLLFL